MSFNDEVQSPLEHIFEEGSKEGKIEDLIPDIKDAVGIDKVMNVSWGAMLSSLHLEEDKNERNDEEQNLQRRKSSVRRTR
jgi:hypothetical protein